MPEEERICKRVVEYLGEYVGEPLVVDKVEITEGRGNLIIKYPGEEDGRVVSFVGSHMDVVPANAEVWDRDPFQLQREGDEIFGRGVTDCLGHVALLSVFLKQLAIKKVKLKTTVIAVFIADEEGGQGQCKHVTRSPHPLTSNQVECLNWKRWGN